MQRAFEFRSQVTRLQRASKQLFDTWEAVGEDWDDAVRDRYQDRYLDTLRGRLQGVQTSIRDFAELMEKMVRELEE